MIVKDILDAHKVDYEGLFIIETTTSSDRHGVVNQKLKEDKIWDRIKERLDKLEKEEKEKEQPNDEEPAEETDKKNKTGSKTSCCRPTCFAP